MDLGLDDDEALAAVVEASNLIEAAREIWKDIPFCPAASSTVDELRQLPTLNDPTVDLVLTLDQAGSSTVECLDQVRRFIDEKIPTEPFVLASLMRSALLASAKIVYILGPSTREEQARHALHVLVQETNSLFRCYNASREFHEFDGLRVEDDIYEHQAARKNAIYKVAGQQGFSESKILAGAALVVGQLVQDSADAAKLNAGSAMAEHLQWIFNLYSGKAHGMGWPRLVFHEGDLPGDFSADFRQLASMSYLAMDLMRRHYGGCQT